MLDPSQGQKCFQDGNSSSYHDNLTRLNVVFVSENIFSGHFVFNNSHFEFLNEGVVLSHAPQGCTSGRTHSRFLLANFQTLRHIVHTSGMSTLTCHQRDPLYSDVGRMDGPVVGLRYKIDEFTAYKLEYSRTMRHNLDSTNNVGMQLAFAFRGA